MTEPIDFSQYEIDLFGLGDQRRLGQFKRGPIRCAIMSEQTRQAQELIDAIIDALKGRTIAGADTYALDVIGRIVGQPRVIPSLDGGLPFDNDQYRVFISAKIFKNHCLHGSIPEVLHFVKLAFGIDISIYKLGMSDIKIGVPSDISPDIAETLSLRIDDERAENQYFLPFGATTRLLGVLYLPTTPSYFTPDRFSGRTDYAHVAVSSL